ncbi:MAG: transposase [Porticoccus sp.]|jgi:transposase
MPRYNRSRKTWKDIHEFKEKAVEPRSLQDIKIKDVAKALNIHPFMLSRWRKKYREGKTVADKKVTSFSKETKELGVSA